MNDQRLNQIAKKIKMMSMEEVLEFQPTISKSNAPKNDKEWLYQLCDCRINTLASVGDAIATDGDIDDIKVGGKDSI